MTRSSPFHDLAFAAAAIGLAALVALAVSLAPAASIERLVEGSGLPSLFSAAAPPLGPKARALLAFVSGAAAALAFLAAYLILEYRARATRRRPASFTPMQGAPSLRRSDAHPDAPARRPIFAALDLGVVDETAAAEPKPRSRETVADLLARFERGLERRRVAVQD